MIDSRQKPFDDNNLLSSRTAPQTTTGRSTIIQGPQVTVNNIDLSAFSSHESFASSKSNKYSTMSAANVSRAEMRRVLHRDKLVDQIELLNR